MPEYGKNRWYELPRYGTTVKVFERTFPETEIENISEKGKKLYNLVWKNGKFTVQK